MSDYKSILKNRKKILTEVKNGLSTTLNKVSYQGQCLIRPSDKAEGVCTRPIQMLRFQFLGMASMAKVLYNKSNTRSINSDHTEINSKSVVDFPSLRPGPSPRIFHRFKTLYYLWFSWRNNDEVTVLELVHLGWARWNHLLGSQSKSSCIWSFTESVCRN